MPEQPAPHRVDPPAQGGPDAAHIHESEASFMALVSIAARDPRVRSYFASLLEATALTPQERDAIWRSFEAAAAEALPPDR
jgi:hypothetical protein